MARQFAHFDSLHPEHISAAVGHISAPSIRYIAALRAQVILSDRRTWDWTSDGSCTDPYWQAHRAMAQRAAVIGIRS